MVYCTGMYNTLYHWSIKRAGFVMAPLFFLNWVGVEYSLYGLVWWWDVMTHFLGGIFIGFLVLALVNSKIGRTVCKNHSWWLWVAGALAIYIGWEVYEVVVNLVIPTHTFDYLDTLHDIVNDCLGGLVAYYWYRQFYIKHDNLSE